MDVLPELLATDQLPANASVTDTDIALSQVLAGTLSPVEVALARQVREAEEDEFDLLCNEGGLLSVLGFEDDKHTQGDSDDGQGARLSY